MRARDILCRVEIPLFAAPVRVDLLQELDQLVQGRAALRMNRHAMVPRWIFVRARRARHAAVEGIVW